MNEAHFPKRPDVEVRAKGALEYVKGHRDADAMQNQYGGKRYNLSVTKKLAEMDTKTALMKAGKAKKGRTDTGKPSEPIEIDPNKNIINQANL